MQDIIIKTSRGYERDDGSARYIYNDMGKYLGQWQPDIISECLDASEIYFQTYPGDRCFHTLTKAQMALAQAKIETGN